MSFHQSGVETFHGEESQIVQQIQQSSIKCDCSCCFCFCLPTPENALVLLTTHFASKVKNFNLENYSFISVVIHVLRLKRDKVDLMVKHSTIERKVYLHTHAAGGCAM
jgi:hypothetical protein